MSDTLSSLIEERFGERVDVPEALERNPELIGLAAHRSHRAFTPEPDIMMAPLPLGGAGIAERIGGPGRTRTFDQRIMSPPL